MPLSQKGLRSSKEETIKNDEGSEEEVNTTDERGRRWILGISEERLQDFLMPGLRHAHTLQQLRDNNEYLQVFIIIVLGYFIFQKD